MLYTLTLNPAIDLFIDTPRLDADVVNRTNSYDVQANGKGVNVSFILQRLHVPNQALGIGGGFTLATFSNSFQRPGSPTTLSTVAALPASTCSHTFRTGPANTSSLIRARRSPPQPDNSC